MVGTSDFVELIKGRRSIRAWQDRPVPEELLVQAIELATWAPNGANAQIWFFYLILDSKIIKTIGDAARESMEMVASWPETAKSSGFPPRPSTPEGQEAPPPPKRSPLSDAPAMILVGAKNRENPLNKILAERAQVDEKAAQMLEWSKSLQPGIQSVAAGIAYLLLALHQLGLGATWMTGPLSLTKGEVEKLIGVPSNISIIALIPVGYPDDTPQGIRRPVSEICRVIK